MNSAWYNKTTGQLIPRAPYSCSEVKCPNCGPDRVSRYLMSVPDFWPESGTFFLASPMGRNWKAEWEYACSSARRQGLEVEYLVVRRENPMESSREAWLWASTDDVAYASTSSGWVEYDFFSAWQELRDQLCLPGPMPNYFPPHSSPGWKVAGKKSRGGQPRGWDRMVIDMEAYESAFRREAYMWERSCGVHPESDSALPDPDAWLKRLTDLHIIVGQ